MITQLIPKTAKGRRPQLKMTPRYITIHSTGNPRSTAKNEADNVCNNSPNAEVSFHVVVDDKQAYQVMPFSEVAWHAGDGFTGVGNRKSIGVEICESGDRKNALLNAVKTVKDIMQACNISIDRVVKHKYWSGKNCPRILIDKRYIKDGLDWCWFLKQIRSDDMTKDEVLKIIKGNVYKMPSDVPDWAKPTINKYVKKGYIAPNDDGSVNLTHDMVRTFVILDRVMEGK